MASEVEREWLVYLIGPAGIIEVIVRSASGPEVTSTEIILGECRFNPEAFAGAFLRENITYDRVHLAP
jgi:hypothetical protein